MVNSRQQCALHELVALLTLGDMNVFKIPALQSGSGARDISEGQLHLNIDVGKPGQGNQ